LLKEILAGVLEVLEQCRRQEGGFEAVEYKMEEEYRRRRYLYDKKGKGRSDLSLCRIHEIRGCSGGYGNCSHDNQGIAQMI